LIPIAFAASVVRSGCATATATAAPAPRRDGGSEQPVRRPAHVQDAAVDGGLDPDAAAVDEELRVLRLRRDRLAELLEVVRRRRPADRELGRAVRRELEQLREPPARDAVHRAAERQPDGAREHPPRLRERRRQIAARHLRLIDAELQADAVPAVERRERGEDRRGGAAAIEHPADLAGDELRLQAVQDEGGVDVRTVDGLGDGGDPCLQRRPVERRLRRHVRAEDAQLEPAEAAHREEAVAFPKRVRDCAVPVPLQPDLPAAEGERPVADGEYDRSLLDLATALLEQRRRDGRSHAADVDVRDPDARRQRCRRACERERHGRHPQHGEERRDERDPLHPPRARLPGAAQEVRRRDSGSGFGGQVGHSTAAFCGLLRRVKPATW
jgi:hypothetical protein